LPPPKFAFPATSLITMKPNHPIDNDSNRSFAQALSLGIALGAGVGTALGVATHNLAIGLSLGAGLSLAFTVAFHGKRCGNDDA
jgi:hypothetical protein